MISNEMYAVIAALDLDPIKVKLMHQESGEGWSLETANAIEGEYRRFLYLMKAFPNEQTAPRFDVDIFWHYHILDTMKYAADCERVFGYFLHHFPYIGLRGEDDEAAHHRIGERMRVLYEQTFMESYDRVPSAQAATAFSAAAPATGQSATASATAFSAAQPLVAFSAANPRTAFSAATSAAVAATAFSAATTAVAFSAAQPRTAFSASVARSADAVDPIAASNQRFYSERPTLAAA